MVNDLWFLFPKLAYFGSSDHTCWWGASWNSGKSLGEQIAFNSCQIRSEKGVLIASARDSPHPTTDGNFCHPKTTVFGPILKSILCYWLWWFPTPCWRKNCRQDRLWWAGISSTGSEWHLSLPEHCWLIAGQEQQVSPRRTLQTVNWPDRDTQYLVGRDWWGGRVQQGRRGVRLVRGWRQNLIRSRSCSAGWWGHWWVAWGLRKERRGLIIVHIIIISVTRISMIIIISVMTIFLNSATILVSDKLVPSSSYLSLIFETDKHKKKTNPLSWRLCRSWWGATGSRLDPDHRESWWR